MMKKIMAIIIFLAVIASLSWWIFNKKTSQPREFSSQTAVLGAVEIEIKPEKLDSKESVFSVKLDTHTVELDFDLTKIISLSDGSGNRYQALRWEGGSAGHHLAGKLVFAPLAKKTKTITLTVSQIGKEKKVFNWNFGKGGI